MAIRRSIKGSQPKAVLLGGRVDGSVVTTTTAKTGLLEGEHDMQIKKGSGGTSNEVTVTLDITFKRVPVVVATPITTDTHIEIKSVTTSVIVFETFAVDDGSTAEDDVDFHFMVLGWDSSSEYNSR